ncbi:MAG: sensor histidine kinase [Clostridiaceae bacterium]
MFKKLRTRLLIMNLSIIMVLMLISFSSIYIITYNNIHDDINQNLTKIVDIKKEVNPPELKQEGGENINLEEKNQNDELPNRLVSFIFQTDKKGDILSRVSSFDAENSFYEEALRIVELENDYTGNFTLDDNEWAYLIKENKFGYVYGFFDMTSQKELLNRLLYTFAFVFIGMIFIVFIISNFLTNRSIKPIKDAFDKQKQFISDASHELKTPLAVIATNVDVLLLNQESKDAPDSKWLLYIKSEVERMGKLTKNLLYLTQMEANEQQELIRYSFNFSESVEQQILGMEVLAFEKNIDINYRIEPDIEIIGNDEQLTQVVVILLDNALKYTPEKGKINLSLSSINHQIYFSVMNTGEGVEDKDLNRIFDRFYRVDKARSRENGSHGLGLSIAKAIVEQHGGKISCQSVKGESTTFTVKLKKN